MLKLKIKFTLSFCFIVLLAAPGAASALYMQGLAGGLQMPPLADSLLQMPQTANGLADMFDFGAQSYVVADADSGQILINKNSNLPWPPASLTKLVTAMVVLDTKPNLKKTVAMTAADQAAGDCTSGGACIYSRAGVRFTVDGLFHAALMPSANNAAYALAMSTGMSVAQFAAKMNAKAAALGAANSHFNEPTGLDPTNVITAADYAKIVNAAFSIPYLRQIASLTNFSLRSTNNYRYNQTIKNTDQLLGNSDIQILGAKTGYLNESKYNFASVAMVGGQKLDIVVLGENHLYTAFDETKQLADLAQTARILALFQNFSGGEVLGTSTTISANN